jgi:hypothetical protein
MSGDPETEDDFWFRPVWDEESLEPPGPPLLRARKPAAAPDYTHPLLTPLARAQDAVARLEAKAETASEAVAEGLRARMAYLEAAGWLRHAHVWIHPWDLALRDHDITGSYAAAAYVNRLQSELPSTVKQESGFEAAPSDLVVEQGLRLARQWRRLAELRSWRPLADAGALRETLQSLGCRLPEDAEIADWLASVHMLQQGPALIRAGRAAIEWMNLPGIKSAIRTAFSSPHACGARKPPARPSSAFPSGRRRKPVITDWGCISAWIGWRIISVASRPRLCLGCASSNGCAMRRKRAGPLGLRHVSACRTR